MSILRPRRKPFDCYIFWQPKEKWARLGGGRHLKPQIDADFSELAAIASAKICVNLR